MLATDTILDEITCVRCGYRLRGLPNRGRCPECAAPIRSSTRPTRADSRRARWYDRCLWVVILAGVPAGIYLVTHAKQVDVDAVARIALRVTQASMVASVVGFGWSAPLRRSPSAWIFAVLAAVCFCMSFFALY